VSMVGDGGGENEGIVHGMHAQLEADVPGYVRRRCLGHLAWRVTDAVITGISRLQPGEAACRVPENRRHLVPLASARSDACCGAWPGLVQ